VPAATPSAFAYAIVRVVPHVERGERFNVGVVLYSRQHDFLGALVALDEVRLAALAPDVSASDVRSHLEAIVRVAEGDAQAGPIAALPQSERFGWLVAPSSTIIQTSEVHTGLCGDPAQRLERLFARLVEPVAGR
jgi:hypothetical protein